MADALDRAGVGVVLHTARDAELMPTRGVTVCRCMDWLRDAGCENADILDHCRAAAGVHVRGCWVVDLVLGKV